MSDAGAGLEQALTHAQKLIQQGALADAEPILANVLDAQPHHAGANFLMGLLMHQAGQSSNGLPFLDQACRSAPDVAAFQLNRGVVLEAAGDTAGAEGAYRAAIRLDANYAVAHGNLGFALQAKGEVLDALDSFMRATALDPAHIGAHRGLVSVLAQVRAREYRPELEAAFLRCLASPHAAHEELAPAIALQLKFKLAITPESATRDDWDLDTLGSDALLIRYLESCLNIELDLERALASIRRQMLLAERIDGAALDLAAALAQQGFVNEYVMSMDEAEAARLSTLSDAVSLSDTEDLLRIAMYRPLGELDCADAILHAGGRDPRLDALARLTIADSREEEALKPTIEPLTDIDDVTSMAVRQQYEENPYPRWRHIPRWGPEPVIPKIRRLFPHATPPAFLQGGYDILVAGAGTGRHPIQVALRQPDAWILAVDLSLSSLAYGARMAAAHGITNIEFRHGDILALGALERRFEMIESIGVLHHMKHPIEGWRVITSLLRPGGVMRLGLYSERGRHGIVRCRDIIADEAIGSTPDDIRRFRRRLIDDPPADGDFTSILRARDFYSVSMARDLLFHVQEERYTPLRLKEEMAALGLRFLGFEELGAVDAMARYRADHPDDPTMTNLDNWDAFEQAHPDAVEGYVFWCQKED